MATKNRYRDNVYDWIVHDPHVKHVIQARLQLDSGYIFKGSCTYTATNYCSHMAARYSSTKLENSQVFNMPILMSNAQVNSRA